MQRKHRTKKDIEQLLLFDRELLKQENYLFRDVRKAKNEFVRIAAKNFENSPRAIPQQLESEFTDEVIEIIKKRADGTIKGFIPITAASIGEELPLAFPTLIRTLYFEKYGLIHARSIAETSVKDVQRRIAIGRANGLSSKQIATQIRKLTALNKFRAETIARTETGFASHFAQRSTVERMQEISNEQLYKKWLTSLDGRVRTSPPSKFDHVAMEGVVVKEDEFFNVQGDRIYAPRDPNGQAGNVINCRCTIALYKASELNL